MRREIPLSVPNLDSAIADNLKECIETGWVSTGGRFITEFEDKMKDYLQTGGAASVQSGTAGLQLALRALEIGPGDEVIVPTLTFIASVNPVVYQGAAPVFMDCDDSLCMDPDKLAAFLKDGCERKADGRLVNKASERQVKAIMVVHIFGNMADMEGICDLAEEYGLPLLEDAAEALGSKVTEGRYAGKHAGTIGDIGVYSFNANKIITTGGGGMVVAKEKEMLERIRYLSLTAKDDALYYVHDDVGYNYRMLNLQAALGVSQIDQLEAFIDVKAANFREYQEQLADVPGLGLIPFRQGIRANHWFYSLTVDEERFGMDRNTLMDCLIAEGIQCRPVWRLCHLQKPYREWEAWDIVRAVIYGDTILNLPCSTTLSKEDVIHICRQIKGLYRK